MRVLQTPARKRGGEWEDLEAIAFDLTLWEEAAENAVRSLDVGTAVVGKGRLTSVTIYQSKGEGRTCLKVDVDVLGVSLKKATAVVSRRVRGTAAPERFRDVQPADRGFDVVGDSAWAPAPADDPWGAR